MNHQWTMATFEPFQQYLLDISGLYFAPDRSHTLIDKVHDRMKATHFSDPLKYLQFLKSDPQGGSECKNLLELITIGETFFFRNEPQFDALQVAILPKLLQKKSKSLRIWCAGCSTGEEPYSIAMLLHGMMSGLEGWDVSILATDINRHALEKARLGIYGKRALHLTPRDMLVRYFTQSGAHFVLSDDIKRMVTFQYHNLASEPFNLPGMIELDILFCRNVTIYFDMPTLKRIIAQFSDCLVPGGTLLIGHAETLWGISDMFAPIEFPRTFLYEKLAAPLPAVQYTSLAAPPISIPLPDPMPVYTPPVEVPKVVLPVSKPNVNIPTWLEKGIALANEGQYEESLEYLKKVVEHDNLQASAYHVMGVVFAKLHRYNDAIAEFRRALYCDSEFAVCHFHLGNVYRFRGEHANAQKEYQRCLMVLKNKDEAEDVPFSEGLTVGILAQAVRQAQAAVRAS